MKIQKTISLIFLFIATIINCEDGKTYIIKMLENSVKYMVQSTFLNYVVVGYENTIVDVIFDTVELSELDDIKIMYDLPYSLIKQAKSVKVKEPSIQKSVKEKNPYDTYELSFSIAYKEDNGKITLALITTRSKAKVRKLDEPMKVKKCEMKFNMFKYCYYVEERVERELDFAEIDEVIYRTRYTAHKLLLEVVDILKKGEKLIRNGNDISLK